MRVWSPPPPPLPRNVIIKRAGATATGIIPSDSLFHFQPFISSIEWWRMTFFVQQSWEQSGRAVKRGVKITDTRRALLENAALGHSTLYTVQYSVQRQKSKSKNTVQCTVYSIFFTIKCVQTERWHTGQLHFLQPFFKCLSYCPIVLFLATN